MDYSKTPPVPFTETVNESDPTIENVGIAVGRQQAIEGPSMQMDYLQGIYKQLRGNKGDLMIINHREGDGVIKPESREQLQQILKDAHDRRKPVIMGVFANRGPFLDDLNESYSGKPLTEQEKKIQERMHAHHALVATDLEPSSGLVTVENQWGDRVDHTGEAGQKDKLDLGTLFDTVREKPVGAEAANAPERSKPTPEDWMRQQREFVEKLEGDKDVDPQVMFRERMTLRKYLNHWGQNGEAEKQDKILAEGLSERLRSGKEDSSLMGDVELYLLGSKDFRESEHVKQLLSAADDKFRTIPSTDKEYSRKFQQHLKFHTMVEDNEGAGRLAHDVVTRFLQEHSTPENIANKESRNQLSSLVDTLEENQIHEEAKRVAESMLENLRNYERKHGPEHREVVEIKSTLSFLGEQKSFPEMKAVLAKEMKESYQRLKQKGDITSEESMSLRFSLNHIYEQSRNPHALNELLHDGFDYLTTHGGRGGKYQPDSKEMIGPYTYAADRLVRAGGKEFAIPLMERALEIAKTKDPERVETIATDLVHRLDSLGRSADADRIVKDTGVNVIFRRINERKAISK